MDFSRAFGATDREVDKGYRDGRTTHIVRASRIYSTTGEDLWNAMTSPARLQRWFGEVSCDFKLGGPFSIKNNANGIVTHCEAPKLFALTWEFGDTISWVKVAIKNVENGALLTLEHELPTDEKSEAHWDQYGPGATGVGWDMALMGLDAHLSASDKALLDAGMKWAESEHGKVSLRDWSTAWAEAYIKAGAPEKIATDMAERTANFYTGVG